MTNPIGPLQGPFMRPLTGPLPTPPNPPVPQGPGPGPTQAPAARDGHAGGGETHDALAARDEAIAQQMGVAVGSVTGGMSPDAMRAFLMGTAVGTAENQSGEGQAAAPDVPETAVSLATAANDARGLRGDLSNIRQQVAELPDELRRMATLSRRPTVTVPAEGVDIPGLWSGVGGAVNIAGGVMGVMSGADQLSEASAAYEEGNVLHAALLTTAGTANIVSGTAGTYSGGVMLGGYVAQMRGATDLARTLSAEANALGPLTMRLGGAASIATGALDMYSGLTSEPINQEQVVTGALTTTSGVLMLMPPPIAFAGVALGIGLTIYENWDTITDTAAAVADAVGDTAEAIVEGVTDTVEAVGEAISDTFSWLTGGS